MSLAGKITNLANRIATEINTLRDEGVPTGGTTGQVLAKADTSDYNTEWVDAANTEVPINTQTGTTYTLVLADKGKLIRMNNASAITLTVPTNASVAFPTGSVITVTQTGVGVVSVAGSGVTINTFDGNDTAGQYAYVQLIKVSTNVWDLIGGIS